MKIIRNTVLMSIITLLSSHALSDGVTEQIPKRVQCILEGAGAGYCRIIFPQDLSSNCTDKAWVIFSPETSILGKEIYSMALAAVTSKTTLKVAFIDSPCLKNASSIDWITYGK